MQVRGSEGQTSELVASPLAGLPGRLRGRGSLSIRSASAGAFGSSSCLPGALRGRQGWQAQAAGLTEPEVAWAAWQRQGSWAVGRLGGGHWGPSVGTALGGGCGNGMGAGRGHKVPLAGGPWAGYGAETSLEGAGLGWRGDGGAGEGSQRDPGRLVRGEEEAGGRALTLSSEGQRQARPCLGSRGS